MGSAHSTLGSAGGASGPGPSLNGLWSTLPGAGRRLEGTAAAATRSCRRPATAPPLQSTGRNLV